MARTSEVDGIPVRITTPAKTVADTFKCRPRLGLDVAIEPLKPYLEAIA
jgi:hypothetical protein